MPSRMIFDNVAEAQAYVFDVLNGDADRFTHNTMTRASLARLGGAPLEPDAGQGFELRRGYTGRSFARRERVVYGFQEFVHALDRLYLHERDSLTRALNTVPPRDTWFKLPITSDDNVNAFFTELTDLGFVQHAIAADVLQRRDGGAFLYVDASGNLDEPLTASSTWHGFDHVSIHDVDPDTIEFTDTVNPLTNQHRIESLGIFQSQEDVKNHDPTIIHGSRLVQFKEDQESRWWFGRSKIDPVFDDVQNIRDILYAQKQAQFEGQPIVVEVDTEEGFTADTDDIDDMETEMREIVTGARDAFSPIEGVTISRLEPTDLQDPDAVLQALASRVAMFTEFTPNHVMMATRAQGAVGPEEELQYESAVMVRREVFGMPILRHIIRMGQRGKRNGLPRRDITIPFDADWPRVRDAGARQEALIDQRDSLTLINALEMGRLPPDRVLRKFPENPAGPVSRPSQGEPDRLRSNRQLNASVDPALREAVEQVLRDLVDDGAIPFTVVHHGDPP